MKIGIAFSISLLIGIFNLDAQDTIYNFYTDGTIKEIFLGTIYSDDTVKHGFYKYLVDGNLIQQGNYNNNQLEGDFFIYYCSGKIKFIYQFKNNRKNGVFKLNDYLI